MRIASDISALIGHTPLAYLSRYSASEGLESPIVAKLEYFESGRQRQGPRGQVDAGYRGAGGQALPRRGHH